MQLSELKKPKETGPIAKRVPDGYREGKMTWAVVKPGPYGDEVLESGFDTKRDALDWIERTK